MQDVIKGVVNVVDVVAILYVIKSGVVPVSSNLNKILTISLGLLIISIVVFVICGLGWGLAWIAGGVPRMWSGWGADAHPFAYVIDGVEANIRLVIPQILSFLFQ